MRRRELLISLLALPVAAVAEKVSPSEIRRAIMIFGCGEHYFAIEGTPKPGAGPGTITFDGTIPVNAISGTWKRVGGQAWARDRWFIYAASELPDYKFEVEPDGKPQPIKPDFRVG